MANRETILQQRIREALGHYPHLRVFRNNVGMAWDREGKRPVRFGLCDGSSDLIGIRSIQITPDMVGQTIGQFIAIEVKTGNGRLTKQQRRFLGVIADMGGYAIVARSTDDLEGLNDEF